METTRPRRGSPEPRAPALKSNVEAADGVRAVHAGLRRRMRTPFPSAGTPQHVVLMRSSCFSVGALLLAASGCTETLTETKFIEQIDTVLVTDTLVVSPVQYRVDTVATGFDRPVTVRADEQGLMVAEQRGRIVRLDGSLVLDLRPLIPADLNFVGGLRNLLVVDGRSFVFLTTVDERVLVAEASAGALDTLLITSELQVQHFGGGLAWYDGRLLVALGDGDTGDGRGPGLPGKVLAIDPATRQVDQVASGLRNPWRMALSTDTLWIADPEDRRWEEVNALDLREPGADFGWGIAEGSQCDLSDCSGTTPPLYEYPTGPECSSVIGGAVYQDRFWFADYCEGWVRSVGAEGIASHHLDLDDRIIALASPISGEPPFIVTERGAVLRVVAVSP